MTTSTPSKKDMCGRTIPDELHPEILERLRAHPQSLARASAVCRAWRHIVNDPGFLRRYRGRHRTPLTMGFFHNSGAIPRPFVHVDGFAGFSGLERPAGNSRQSWKFMDCRHGRVLLYEASVSSDRCFYVWHPMTGYCHPFITVPNVFKLQCDRKNINAALICCDEVDDNHYMNHCKPAGPFRMALMRSNSRGRVCAKVFSSLTGKWSPEPEPVDLPPECHIRAEPCAVVGDTMYQPLYGYRVLAYDTGKGTLTAFERPRGGNVRLMKADGGARLGLAAAHDLTVRLWVRDADDADDGGWVLRRTVDLGKLVAGLSTAALPWSDPRFPVTMPRVKIVGVAEEGDALFLWTMVGVLMMCPKSLEVRKVHETAEGMEIVYPYAAFYLLHDS